MTDKKRYDVIDLEKFTMSLFVAAIHINPLGKYSSVLYPWIRMAVPFFFICSGFFLFSELEGSHCPEKLFAKFGKRCVLLYLTWSVALLPIVVFLNRDASSLREMLLRLIGCFLLTGTFGGSWYLIALIEGSVIVYFVSKSKKMFWVLSMCSVAIYIVCCLASNYAFLLDGRKLEVYLNNYHKIMGMPIYLSWPVSLLWICIGRAMACNIVNLQKLKKLPLLLLLIAALTLLMLEEFWLSRTVMVNSRVTDSYLCLPFVVVLLFFISVQCFQPIKRSLFLRKASTVVFCLHHSVNRILEYGINRFWPQGINVPIISLSRFILVLLVCLLITQLLVYIGKRKNSMFRYMI